MAACFSSSGTYGTPFVYVLSQIPNLAKCLMDSALPGIQVKSLDVSEFLEKNPVLNDEKLNFIKQAEIAVCDGNILSKMYKYMPNLKWAHCTWAGVEPIMKEISKEPPFVLTRHSSEVFCGMMAEYVICHILNCERQVKQCWKYQESKVWSTDEKINHYRTLNELTICILGVGNMATEIAKCLKSRGANVYGFAKTPRLSVGFGFFDKISCKLEEVLPVCDYVCNTLPSTPLTRGMLNASTFLMCTRKPVFINVGRGDIIPESELVQALRSGCLSGAVLDVFETEPLPSSSPLWDMSQVTITPHVAAVSRPLDIAEGFYDVFKSYIEGHELKNLVKWSDGY